jgi:hypothetical protein
VFTALCKLSYTITENLSCSIIILDTSVSNVCRIFDAVYVMDYMQKRSSLLCDVAQRILLIIYDVSGLPLGPIFKGQAVQVFIDCLTHEVGTER